MCTIFLLRTCTILTTDMRSGNARIVVVSGMAAAGSNGRKLIRAAKHIAVTYGVSDSIGKCGW